MIGAILLLIVWTVGGILIVSSAAGIAGVEMPDWPGTELFPVSVGLLWPIALVCVIIMAIYKGQPPLQVKHDDVRDEEPRPSSGRRRQ